MNPEITNILEYFIELESSSIGTIINESDWAYPAAISLHALGMGVFVGVAILGHLWSFGMFPGLTAQTIRKLFMFAWPALLLNGLSGVCMFIAQASIFIVHPYFLLKLGALFFAALISAYFYKNIYKEYSGTENRQSPLALRAWSAIGIMLLVIVIVSGRLVAYTGGFA